jgi:hypothetical protein
LGANFTQPRPANPRVAMRCDKGMTRNCVLPLLGGE